MSLEYKIEAVSEAEFASLGTAWNQLLLQSSSRSFFLKWEWLYAFWTSIKSDKNRLAVLTIKDHANLVAIAPLYATRRSCAGIPMWKIHFLGDKVASDYLDFIIKPGHEQKCVQLFLDELFAHYPFAAMELSDFSQDSILHQYVIPELSKRRVSSISFPVNNCPEIALPHDENELNQQLSYKTRYTVRKRERELRKQFDVEFKFMEFDKTDESVDTLFRLHGARWDSIEATASTFNNDFRKDFHHKFNSLAGKDDGFFSLARVNDAIASIILIFHLRGDYFFYQKGWDPQFSKFSISIVHLYHVILYCIERNGENFRMLRGDDPYKHKFANASQTLYRILIYKNTLLGKTNYWTTRIARAGKKLVKKMLKRAPSQPQIPAAEPVEINEPTA